MLDERRERWICKTFTEESDRKTMLLMHKENVLDRSAILEIQKESLTKISAAIAEIEIYILTITARERIEFKRKESSLEEMNPAKRIKQVENEDDAL